MWTVSLGETVIRLGAKSSHVEGFVPWRITARKYEGSTDGAYPVRNSREILRTALKYLEENYI